MARQDSFLKIKGTIDDISFYKSKGVHYVRKKGGVDGTRIKNDATFARTRENNNEFGSVTGSGKLLRTTIRPILIAAADSGSGARLTKLMAAIKNMDATSSRGERNVGAGLATADGLNLLKGFDFNEGAPLKSVLFKAFSVNTTTGGITINGLIPRTDIASPKAASHLKLTAGWANVDFSTKTGEAVFSTPVTLPIDGTSNNVSLAVSAPPTGTGTDLFLLKIEFLQVVNGQEYPLNDGTFNCLQIVEVV